MKFKSILATIAICIAAISCTKENTEPEKVCLDGSYDGKMEMNVAGSPVDPVSICFDIKNHVENTLVLVSPDFEVNAMGMKIAMPSISIENISVTEAEGLFTLNAAPFSVKVEMMGQPMVFESKKGLSGTVKDGKLNVAFDITPGAMPMAIDCTFEGTKKL